MLVAVTSGLCPGCGEERLTLRVLRIGFWSALAGLRLHVERETVCGCRVASPA